jgi:hypothetical protein
MYSTGNSPPQSDSCSAESFVVVDKIARAFVALADDFPFCCAFRPSDEGMSGLRRPLGASFTHWDQGRCVQLNPIQSNGPKKQSTSGLRPTIGHRAGQTEGKVVKIGSMMKWNPQVDDILSILNLIREWSRG